MSTTAATSPKGYYLLFGVNQFSDPNFNLGGCVPDMEYWKDLLPNSYYYSDEDSHVFTDQNATIYNFAMAMLDLAIKANDGDIVFVGLSTHGVFSPATANSRSNHSFLTHHTNIRCSSNMFNFLLKLFRKGVRVNIVFDICQAEGMADSNTNVDLTEYEETVLGIAFASLPGTMQDALKLKMANNQNIPMSASIMEFSSVQRVNFASDQGWVRMFSKSQIFRGMLWWQYTAKSYRDKMEKCFDDHIIQNCFPGHVKFLVNNYAGYPNAKSTIENNMSFYKITAEQTIRMFMQHPWTIFIPFLEELIDESSWDANTSTFEQILNIYQIHVNGMPNLHFKGVKNQTFEDQWVFCK